MGDRANIIMAQENGQSIYLYTHWNGYKLANTLIRALKRKQRWDDEPYLTRIITAEVIREAGGLDCETGSGITTYMTDGDDRIIEVRVKHQMVKSEVILHKCYPCLIGYVKKFHSSRLLSLK